MSKGKNARKEIEILAAPTSSGVKLTSAFLIRIKELPHTMLNIISKSQALPDSDEVIPFNVIFSYLNRATGLFVNSLS